MKRALPILGAAVVVVLAVLWVRFGAPALQLYQRHMAFDVPQYAAPTKRVWLKQNWTPGASAWFHHTDQGTMTFGMPYEWFVALTRPELFADGQSRFADPAYMDRFGFIPDPQAPSAWKLPVGFAQGNQPIDGPDGAAWINPQSGKGYTGLGLTCAACHTGRLTYRGQEMLIDGGPALTNLDAFRRASMMSLVLTRHLPWRWQVFEDRVLGSGASAAAKAQLTKQVDDLSAAGQAQLAWDDKVWNDGRVDEGFGRLDALNRIGNQVFGVDMGQQANYVATSAPVHFPRIWQAPWFMWVQYNASIMQPMVRNAGEALGVGARLQASGPTLWKSSVPLPSLSAMEEQLSGCPRPDAAKSNATDYVAPTIEGRPAACGPDAEHGFPGLRPPRWSDTPLPPIDAALAQKGAALYVTHCQGCHMPPTTSPAFWTLAQWKLPPNTVKDQYVGSPGARFLDLEVIPLAHIGTDPGQAAGMAKRTVATPAGLGIPDQAFGQALGDVVAKVTEHWYDSQQPPTPTEVRNRMDGGRPNGIRGGVVIGGQSLPGYKVRPLDGIWATPPYLHNASVPNLDALLSPVSKRPGTFYLGNREYDSVKVGYRSDAFKGGFKFDTSIPGNSNAGHEFSNDKRPGVIGPLLTDDERKALIEYLKTL
jgi:hypothetical protein